MLILNVEIMDYRVSAETGRCHATMLMQADGNRICLQAAADISSGRDAYDGLLCDAIRQIGRLPEYRNSSHEITLARGALRGTA